MLSILSRRFTFSQRFALQQRYVRFNSASSGKVSRPEYFINVWDRLGADRRGIADAKDFPTSFHFVGEMLDRRGIADAKDFPTSFHFVGEMLDQNTFDVCGNCLACACNSEEEAMQLLQLTPYFKQGIWDMSTAKISALETVHTSDLVSHKENLGV